MKQYESFIPFVIEYLTLQYKFATKRPGINGTNYKFKHLHYGPAALKWTELKYKPPQAQN